MTNHELTGSSTDWIYEELRRTIFDGQFKPGDRLPMERLANRFGTSVTPVREALRMLLRDGLVTVEPHSGYFVARLSLREVDALLDVRAILEAAAAERAATRITSEQLEELEALSAQPDPTADNTERDLVRGLRFHQLIAKASGNLELAKLANNVGDRLGLYIVERGEAVSVPFAHARIVEALKARDPDAARVAALDEIRHIREVLIREMIEREGAKWYLGAQA